MGRNYSGLTECNTATLEGLIEIYPYLKEEFGEGILGGVWKFPDDVIVFGENNGDTLLFIYRDDIENTNDPPVYFWNAMYYNFDDNSIPDKGIRKISDSFTAYI